MSPQQVLNTMEITTLSSRPASPLGLAGSPNMDPDCARLAHGAGVNYFFFYNLSFGALIKGLKPLLAERREEIVVATGSESRDPGALRRYTASRCGINWTWMG